jgi:hypothetical protein
MLSKVVYFLIALLSTRLILPVLCRLGMGTMIRLHVWVPLSSLVSRRVSSCIRKRAPSDTTGPLTEAYYSRGRASVLVLVKGIGSRRDCGRVSILFSVLVVNISRLKVDRTVTRVSTSLHRHRYAQVGADTSYCYGLCWSGLCLRCGLCWSGLLLSSGLC